MKYATTAVQQIENVRQAVFDWSNSTEPIKLAAVFIGIALVVLFRRSLAKLAVNSVVWLMRQLNASLAEDVGRKLCDAFKVLIVTLAFYIGLDALNPPEIADGILRRILLSVAVTAVFAAWYRLAGPFISLLSNRKFGDLRVEQDWMLRVTQFAIVLFGLTSLLLVWEIDISGAITGVGVLGAGLAIASQDLIRNLIAGMTNLSEARFETGDAIEVPGMLMGTVDRIDLRSTLVVGFDQIPRHVPNSELANSVVLNFSRMKHRRLWVEIPLILSTTSDQIEEIRTGLRDFIESCGLFDLGIAAPKYVYASKLSDYAIEILFIARTKTGGFEDMLIAKEALNLKVLDLVAAAGTELAYPTQTIESKSSNP